MQLKKFNADTCEFDILPIKEVKKIPLKSKIKAHAINSFYRYNAQTADIYAFNIIRDKKIDWEGGWDWSNGLVDTNADYIYSLNDDKFYQLIK